MAAVVKNQLSMPIHFLGFPIGTPCALQVIAANLPEEEIAGLRVQFEEIDADKSGTITAEELGAALKKKGEWQAPIEIPDFGDLEIL